MRIDKILYHGRTPSLRSPLEYWAILYQNLTPCYPPVLPVPAGHEIFLGPSISMQGGQPRFCGWMSIGQLLQKGPYPQYSTWGDAEGSYYPKAYNQREPKHFGGHQGRPFPLSVHPTGHISSRRLGLTNLWTIYIPRPWGFGGNLAGSKASSNVIVHFRTSL